MDDFEDIHVTCFKLSLKFFHSKPYTFEQWVDKHYNEINPNDLYFLIIYKDDLNMLLKYNLMNDEIINHALEFRAHKILLYAIQNGY